MATEIGTGLGLPNGLAPTSTVWERVYIIDGTTAVIVGSVADETVALRTTDHGRSWQSNRTKADAYASWGVGTDGSMALVAGSRKKMKAATGKLPTVDKATLRFSPAEGSLGEPAPFFPDTEKLTGVTIDGGISLPAVLSPELAALLVDQRRAPVIAYKAPAGKEQPPPLKLPRGRYVRAPYARPAQLLTIAGRSITVQPWPSPGEALGRGTPIPGVTATPAVIQQLSTGPSCEFLGWSYQRVTPTPNRAFVIGVSENRSFALPVPSSDQATLGCGTDVVVVETFDQERKEPKLVRCKTDGKCVEPKTNPFEVWPEAHKRTIFAAATDKGVVAAMQSRAGARWGSYLGQSIDGGVTFELPRVIGEGKADRGAFEIGALINFADRVVLLMSAEESGKGRRRWYVMASDDGGSNWGPP